VHADPGTGAIRRGAQDAGGHCHVG
jgi:hypothetical protein